jgi:signal recognition particle subunit SRP54
MVLDSLGKSLRGVLQKIARSSTVDEALLAEVVRDIQRALLQADVQVQLALDLTKRVRERATNEKPPSGASMRDFLVRIIYEEVRRILGAERALDNRPRKILLVGLFGQGKTTTAGKLARYYQKKGVRAALVAADVHRPAAVDQLEQLAKKVGCDVYANRGEKRAEVIVKEALERFPGHETIIVDSAGRSGIDEALLEELRKVRAVFEPEETLLVLDAAMGQSAGRSAAAFHKAAGLTGVVLTKLDGSAKGGIVVAIQRELGIPVKLVGLGEGPDDLVAFDADDFVDALFE